MKCVPKRSKCEPLSLVPKYSCRRFCFVVFTYFSSSSFTTNASSFSFSTFSSSTSSPSLSTSSSSSSSSFSFVPSFYNLGVEQRRRAAHISVLVCRDGRWKNCQNDLKCSHDGCVVVYKFIDKSLEMFSKKILFAAWREWERTKMPNVRGKRKNRTQNYKWNVLQWVVFFAMSMTATAKANGRTNNERTQRQLQNGLSGLHA